MCRCWRQPSGNSRASGVLRARLSGDEGKPTPRDRDRWEREHLIAPGAAAPRFSRCVHRLQWGQKSVLLVLCHNAQPGAGQVPAGFTPVDFPPFPVGRSTPSPPEDTVTPGGGQVGLPIQGPALCGSRSGGLQGLMRAHEPLLGLVFGEGLPRYALPCRRPPPWFQFPGLSSGSTPPPLCPSSLPAEISQNHKFAACGPNNPTEAHRLAKSRAGGQLRDHLIQPFILQLNKLRPKTPSVSAERARRRAALRAF